MFKSDRITTSKQNVLNKELAQSERNIVYCARRLERFLTQPFFTTEQFTGIEGKMVNLEAALTGCDCARAGFAARILHDEFDNYPEQSLYTIGSIYEAVRSR